MDTCHICFDEKNLINLGSCCHQFCADCLDTIVEKNFQLLCPLCRNHNLGETEDEELNEKIFTAELYRNPDPYYGEQYYFTENIHYYYFICIYLIDKDLQYRYPIPYQIFPNKISMSGNVNSFCV